MERTISPSEASEVVVESLRAREEFKNHEFIDDPAEEAVSGLEFCEEDLLVRLEDVCPVEFSPARALSFSVIR